MVQKYDLVLAGTGFASTFFLKKYLEKCGAGKKILVLECGQLYTQQQRIADVKGEKYSGHVTPENMNQHLSIQIQLSHGCSTLISVEAATASGHVRQGLCQPIFNFEHYTEEVKIGPLLILTWKNIIAKRKK